MRTVVLLLLALVLGWGLFQYWPVEAGENRSDTGGEARSSGFLEPIPELLVDEQPGLPEPIGGAAVPLAGEAGGAGSAAATPRPPDRDTAGSSPFDRASSPFQVASGPPQAVRLASLVIHAGPGQVAEFVGAELGDSPDLGHAALAFSEARAGRLDTARELVGDVDDLEGLSTEERLLLARALGLAPAGGAGAAADVSPGEGGLTPLALAMQMAFAEREAAAQLQAGRWAEAARGFSDLLLDEVAAPWPADRASLGRWTEALERAQEHHRWDPRGDWPHLEVVVEPGDSLTTVRKRVVAENPGLKVCTGLIERASGFQEDRVLQPGDLLRVPTDPVRTLVDLDARWAFYLFGDEVAAAWEVSIGAPGSDTRPGSYEISGKQRNPTWFPKGREPVLFGDPENPLGTRWMAWKPLDPGGVRGLGFHGTWEPENLGQAVSDGCIRLRNEDAEELYRILPEGTRVSVRP